ncbi:hypothetical protein F4780DRAFT_780739 [Xylariomycetidae sp. FL0641]|nr:hypothetical protein F4780DRAFT_780739 [Xylariomycetidae sp. FL0641]
MQRSIYALLLQLSAVAAQAVMLNVTAIAGVDGSSVLQCWQMAAPFAISTDAGTEGVARAELGDAGAVSYLVLPSNYDGGLHRAPANQWVAFVSGVAYITVPDDPAANATVVGGEFGLIFAADTADVSEKGHRTQYPGITETIALQVPIGNNTTPAHEVLHGGPCGVEEITGLRGFATQQSN